MIMALETYSALAGTAFDLDAICDDHVLVDEGKRGGWQYVTAAAFKRFMTDTCDWRAGIQPFTASGAETVYGHRLSQVETLTDANVTESFDPHADTWTFWFNDSIGAWQLQRLTEQQITAITGGKKLETYAALGGAPFDLDDIDQGMVVIDEGWHLGDQWVVDAEAFKRFMRATQSWTGSVRPYDNDRNRNRTEFGNQLVAIQKDKSGIELEADVWLFHFNCDKGHWEIDIDFYDPCGTETEMEAWLDEGQGYALEPEFLDWDDDALEPETL